MKDTPLRVRFLGSDSGLHDFTQLIFRGKSETTRLKNLTFLDKIFYNPTTQEADIVVRQHAIWKRGKRRFLIPSFLEAVCETGGDFLLFEKEKLGKTLRWEINKAERSGFGIRSEEGIETLSHFYRNFLVPGAALRHGEQAHVPDFSEFSKLRRKAVVFYLSKNGQDVAATIALKSNRTSTFRIWRNGLSPELVQDQKLMNNAYTWMVVSIIKYSMKHGFRFVNFGLVPPVLNDGQLFYKLKWGCHLVKTASASLFEFDFVSKQAQGLLFEKPLVCYEQGKLCGLMAAPPFGQDFQSLESTLRRLAGSSLHFLTLLCNDFQKGALETLVANLPVEVRTKIRISTQELNQGFATVSVVETELMV